MNRNHLVFGLALAVAAAGCARLPGTNSGMANLSAGVTTGQLGLIAFQPSTTNILSAATFSTEGLRLANETFVSLNRAGERRVFTYDSGADRGSVTGFAAVPQQPWAIAQVYDFNQTSIALDRTLGFLVRTAGTPVTIPLGEMTHGFGVSPSGNRIGFGFLRNGNLFFGVIDLQWSATGLPSIARRHELLLSPQSGNYSVDRVAWLDEQTVFFSNQRSVSRWRVGEPSRHLVYSLPQNNNEWGVMMGLQRVVVGKQPRILIAEGLWRQPRALQAAVRAVEWNNGQVRVMPTWEHAADIVRGLPADDYANITQVHFSEDGRLMIGAGTVQSGGGNANRIAVMATSLDPTLNFRRTWRSEPSSLNRFGVTSGITRVGNDLVVTMVVGDNGRAFAFRFTPGPRRP